MCQFGKLVKLVNQKFLWSIYDKRYLEIFHVSQLYPKFHPKIHYSYREKKKKLISKPANRWHTMSKISKQCNDPSGAPMGFEKQKIS